MHVWPRHRMAVLHDSDFVVVQIEASLATVKDCQFLCISHETRADLLLRCLHFRSCMTSWARLVRLGPLVNDDVNVHLHLK